MRSSTTLAIDFNSAKVQLATMEASIQVMAHVQKDSLNKRKLDRLIKELEVVVPDAIWKICGCAAKVSLSADYDLYPIEKDSEEPK